VKRVFLSSSDFGFQTAGNWLDWDCMEGVQPISVVSNATIGHRALSIGGQTRLGNGGRIIKIKPLNSIDMAPWRTSLEILRVLAAEL
jgi:hypothetical protein